MHKNVWNICIYECKNIFTKVLKKVGMEMPVSTETRNHLFSNEGDPTITRASPCNKRCREGGYARYYYCMPSSPSLLHRRILVSILLGISIPTFFNTYILHLFQWYFIVQRNAANGHGISYARNQNEHTTSLAKIYIISGFEFYFFKKEEKMRK